MTEQNIPCVFKCDIDENLRKELENNHLTDDAMAASYHELRGMAVLELGHVDVELNINLMEDIEGAEEGTPCLDYFICAKYGDGDRDWDSFGYADEYIPSEFATAHVNWGAENWKELLFSDMLRALSLFVMKTYPKLTYLTPNEPVMRGGV